ncbi:MAG: hypothetical protein KAT38_06835, partial [Bacteroidales bacterium]|nr:hypothetical protein [Bacteroidales bacterium]
MILFRKRLSLLVIVFLVLIPLITWGQVDGDYQTIATSDWNNNNTWQVYNSGAWNPCGVGDYPGATAGAGTVYITGDNTVSVTADVSNSIGALTFVGANASNIVQFSGSYILNITGGVTINPPTVGPANNNGIYVNSGIVTCATLTSSNSNNDTKDTKVVISTGGLTVNGDIVMGINAIRNDITFTGAGTLNVTGSLTTGQLTCVNNSTINIGGALTPTAFTISTSTVNFNGVNQNIPFYSYYNLFTSNGGIKTLADINYTVTGNMQISNSTLAFPSAQARTLSVSGDLSGNGTIDMSPGNFTHTLNLGGSSNSIGTLTTAVAVLSTVNYNLAGDQVIFSSPNYKNLTISNGGNKTLGGDVTAGGTLTLSDGKVLLGAYDLTLSGTAAVSNVSSANYIVAVGSGQMKKVFASGATAAYILPVGDATNYSPVSLT